jgi:hypothetical protein
MIITLIYSLIASSINLQVIGIEDQFFFFQFIYQMKTEIKKSDFIYIKI